MVVIDCCCAELTTESSETLEPLEDLCIFAFGLSTPLVPGSRKDGFLLSTWGLKDRTVK